MEAERVNVGDQEGGFSWPIELVGSMDGAVEEAPIAEDSRAAAEPS